MADTREFDRFDRIYKQFKVRNTTRTSTPSQHPSTATANNEAELDGGQITYAQWRHNLVVPNSARKYKVRGAAALMPLTLKTPQGGFDTVISGNINMNSAPITNSPITSQPSTKNPKPSIKTLLGEQLGFKKQTKVKPNIEDQLNSRITPLPSAEDIKVLKVLQERLERRNDKIINIIMLSVKRQLKKLLTNARINTIEAESAVKAKQSKAMEFFQQHFNQDTSPYRKLAVDESRERLIIAIDDESTHVNLVTKAFEAY